MHDPYYVSFSVPSFPFLPRPSFLPLHLPTCTTPSLHLRDWVGHPENRVVVELTQSPFASAPCASSSSAPPVSGALAPPAPTPPGEEHTAAQGAGAGGTGAQTTGAARVVAQLQALRALRRDGCRTES